MRKVQAPKDVQLSIMPQAWPFIEESQIPFWVYYDEDQLEPWELLVEGEEGRKRLNARRREEQEGMMERRKAIKKGKK